MRRLMIAAVCVAMAATAWAVDEDSARSAIQDAFPDAPYARQAAVFQLLSTMQDGDTVMVMINDEVGSFAIQGDRVILQRFPRLPEDVREQGGRKAPERVAPPEEAPRAEKPPMPPQLPQEFASAMVLNVPVDGLINLDLFRAEAERNGRRIATSTSELVSFAMSTGGDLITLTSKGVMCVRSGRAIETLVAVKQLRQEAEEALGYLDTASRRIDRDDVEKALDAPVFYSKPDGIMHRLEFLGQEGRWMSPRFTADITVPEADIAEAQLLLKFLRENDMYSGVEEIAPRVRLDGDTRIKPRAKVTDYSADITDIFTPGEHILSVRTTSTAKDIATGTRFVFEVVFASAPDASIVAEVSGEQIRSVPSKAISDLADDYPQLHFGE
ncbi:MAG: hypothetical protein ACLFWB_08210 [Armatimonadota bacterium]